MTAPITTARPPRNRTNVGALGWPDTAAGDSAPATVAMKCPASEPLPPDTAAHSESVTASPSCTRVTDTAVSRIATGTLTRTERRSIDAL